MDLANYGVVIGNSIFIERRKEIFELIKKRNDVFRFFWQVKRLP